MSKIVYYLAVGVSAVHPSSSTQASVRVAVEGVVVGEVAGSESPVEIYFPVTDANGDGRLVVTLTSGGSSTSPPPPIVGALWVHARKPGALAQEISSDDRVCSLATGKDSKGSFCPTMRPCGKPGQNSTQQFTRGVADPESKRDLSFVSSAGSRQWLNIELYAPTTCEHDNGPLIVYDSWPKPPGWCGLRNEMWNFTTDGHVINRLSGGCLTAGNVFAETMPCNGSEAQQWRVVTHDDLSFQLSNKADGQCLDGQAYHPAPTPPPPDLGPVVASVDVGSDSDVPHDAPYLVSTVHVPPGGYASLQFFVPADGDQCPGAQELAESMAVTQGVWESRQEWPKWVARIADAKVKRALQVCAQTMMMMTELQADGLRVLKGPLHYCEWVGEQGASEQMRKRMSE